MLRTGLLRSKILSASRVTATGNHSAGRNGIKASFATYSGDDAKKPTALARIYLEDGTTLTGRSFGCHKSVEGEVVVRTSSQHCHSGHNDDVIDIRRHELTTLDVASDSSRPGWSATRNP
jgi:hypothetical protein